MNSLLFLHGGTKMNTFQLQTQTCQNVNLPSIGPDIGIIDANADIIIRSILAVHSMEM